MHQLRTFNFRRLNKYESPCTRNQSNRSAIFKRFEIIKPLVLVTIYFRLVASNPIKHRVMWWFSSFNFSGFFLMEKL